MAGYQPQESLTALSLLLNDWFGVSVKIHCAEKVNSITTRLKNTQHVASVSDINASACFQCMDKFGMI